MIKLENSRVEIVNKYKVGVNFKNAIIAKCNFLFTNLWI